VAFCCKIKLDEQLFDPFRQAWAADTISAAKETQIFDDRKIGIQTEFLGDVAKLRP
jgi:hypothetical protein